MARSLAKMRRTALVTAAVLLAAGTAHAAAPVEWTPQASAELEHALHQMHETWNAGDIPALKKLMVGDEVLVSFELDPETHAPIRLRSKQEIDRFVDRVVTTIDDQEVTTELEMPALACRATDSFGVCTEECTVHFKNADGKVLRTDKLWSTGVAVKSEGQWRWIQWHMSVGQPTDQHQPLHLHAGSSR